MACMLVTLTFDIFSGLFSGDLGPLPTKKIFKGMMFILTNVDKTAEQRQQERQLMKDSSLETSTDESAIEGT